MSQRKNLDDTSVNVHRVVEVVLNMTQQHTSQAAYSAMRHGFASVRKLFNEVKRRFEIFSEPPRRVRAILRPPCRWDTNLTVSTGGDFELQRSLMPFNSRNTSRPSVYLPCCISESANSNSS